jgi:hypothetical protein
MNTLAVLIARLDSNMYGPYLTPDTKRRALVGLRIKWTPYANMTMHFSPFYITGVQIVKNVLLHASSMNNFLIVGFFFTLLRIACS